MSRAQARPERWVVSHVGVRGLYAVTPDEPDIGSLTRKVRKALAGGARILQYRNKSANAAVRREQGTALLALCREARIPFVINDDLDLARAIGADGLHLGRDDVSIAAARAQLGEDKLLGVSCYDRLELALAAGEAGADYVAFGSAFPSSTKPEATRAPLSLYREARARLDLPIVAIGGITTENALNVIEAGADAVAVISALFDSPDIEAAARSFSRLFDKKNP
ncbi:MAG: thiamine phosphate synthase [Betaproteobacteria bacterium]|nr:MAG: thiamine phosphate synthase [Betaproteobacteria bacterium]